MGADSIYVHTHLDFEGKQISTVEVDGILALSRSKHVLIEGTGGAGKTMLMRYLLLKAIQDDNYVPILLNLRQISEQDPKCISILNLIYRSLDDLGCKLQGDQFEYSLKSGKYLFLMDGFDEVKESMAAQAAVEIQKFCAKYPNNPCIVTSRPRDEFSRFETFAVAETIPLSKEQAIDLASRLWPKDEKTKEFCRQLDAELFDKHKDFAKNPLLLTMLFLTFMNNNSIPDHLAEFYDCAFDALYRKHDSKHKDIYVREFRCARLSETEFKKLLSRFCFQSLMKQDYEFLEEEVLIYLENSIQKLNLNTICAQDFLQDLVNAVCILVKEGRAWRFSHRSFQAYFAACYTKELSDEEQKLAAEKIMSKINDQSEYYRLLYQIQPQRFIINFLEETLRKIQNEASASELPDVMIARKYGVEIYINFSRTSKGRAYSGFTCKEKRGNCRELLRVFLNAVMGTFREYGYLIAGIGGLANELLEAGIATGDLYLIQYEVVDKLPFWADQDREDFYRMLVKANGFDNLYSEICKLLARLDAEREALTKPNFLEEI